ncbi:hypothetical protein Hanom_Chr11g00978591 [Helianthus anomalus]
MYRHIHLQFDFNFMKRKKKVHCQTMGNLCLHTNGTPQAINLTSFQHQISKKSYQSTLPFTVS